MFSDILCLDGEGLGGRTAPDTGMGSKDVLLPLQL